MSTGGLRIWRNLGWGQRRTLVDLLHTGLSEVGRARVPRQFFLRWPGVHLLDVPFCGDPEDPDWQLVLSGRHLNLRIGGASREGVAFGGPQVYGDQRGNGTHHLAGNVYQYQLAGAERVFEALSPAERERATFVHEPVHTQIELRGSSATPPGVRLGEAGRDARRLAGELVDAILENYPAHDVEYAMRLPGRERWRRRPGAEPLREGGGRPRRPLPDLPS